MSKEQLSGEIVYISAGMSGLGIRSLACRIFPFVVFLFSSLTAFAQPFKPDLSGRVNGPTFKSFCDKRGYTLVGTFDSLPSGKGMAAQVVKGNVWVYLDLNGKEFDSYNSLAKHYGFYQAPPRQEDSRYDYNGELMPVPPGSKYQPFTGTFGEDGEVGYKFRDKILIPPIYDEVTETNYDEKYLFFRVRKDSLYGMCDYAGKLVIPVKYSRLEPLPHASAQCFFLGERDKKYGILSRGGVVTISFEYDEIKAQANGKDNILFLRSNNLTGAASYSGNIIVLVQYQFLERAYDGAPNRGFIAQKNDSLGYLDLSGNVKVPFAYRKLRYNTGDYLTFKEGNKTGVIDTSGTLLFEPADMEIFKPASGNCFIVSTRSYGSRSINIYDLKGKTIGKDFSAYEPYDINNRNPEVYLFKLFPNGDRIIPRAGLFNVRTLKWILPYDYPLVAINENYLKIYKQDIRKSHGSLSGVIDKTGKSIIAAKYDDLEYITREKFAVAKLDGKYGVIGHNDVIIVPVKYKRLLSLSDPGNVTGDYRKIPKGYLIATNDKGRGVITTGGKTTLPFIYDNITATRNGLICLKGDTSYIISPQGAVYNSVTESVFYSPDGIFLYTDNSVPYGLDVYGRKGSLPRKPDLNDYGDPIPAPPLPGPPAPPPAEEKIFEQSEVDTEALFPGGMEAMMAFIAQNLDYPETAIENGIQGKCYLSFIIEKDGSLSDVTLLKKLKDCPECDKEAKKMVRSMPKWIPAKVNGTAVRSKFNLPVMFKM